jgi:hypothetical protein
LIGNRLTSSNEVDKISITEAVLATEGSADNQDAIAYKEVNALRYVAVPVSGEDMRVQETENLLTEVRLVMQSSEIAALTLFVVLTGGSKCVYVFLTTGLTA